jgi:ATP-dependent DNA helicase RecG
MITGSTDVRKLSGVGPKKAEALKRVGIGSVRDLLEHYPRAYQDRTTFTPIGQLQKDQDFQIRGKVIRLVSGNPYPVKKQPIRLQVEDATGILEVVFFNARYLTGFFKKGRVYDFYGRVTASLAGLQMIHPEFSEASEDEAPGILPLYPLAAGLSQKDMRKWTRAALSEISDLPEVLPAPCRERQRLCSHRYAMEALHQPPGKDSLKQGRYRLIFEELFLLQLGLTTLKRTRDQRKFDESIKKTADGESFTQSLPFPMTGAQKKALSEIYQDMESGYPMNRLLQGDVGSGKTVLAEAAIWKAVNSGFQAAFMAPTEILARQHLESLTKDFSAFGIRVAYLGSGLTASERRKTLEGLAKGTIDVVTGTHAILQERVEFQQLGLVITDEQHRFGVTQRSRLTEKGWMPDVLVMTATPIPRTLAVILYGDLDISIVDELPPGRKPVKTYGINSNRREKAYNYAEKEIQAGRQVYIVTPLIQESEEISCLSAEETYEELTKKWPDYQVGLLHGGMKTEEKNRIMEDFYGGRIHALVSTVVIEVGVNVPNATVMIVENAERFGLAQLHQLRGRVGRGPHPSACMLIVGGNSKVAEARVKIMTESGDGFYIAEKDLELRGPGEFFGTRQHGLPTLKIADLIRHRPIMEKARDEATLLLERDPELLNPEHQELLQELNRLFNWEDEGSIQL